MFNVLYLLYHIRQEKACPCKDEQAFSLENGYFHSPPLPVELLTFWAMLVINPGA